MINLDSFSIKILNTKATLIKLNMINHNKKIQILLRTKEIKNLEAELLQQLAQMWSTFIQNSN